MLKELKEILIDSSKETFEIITSKEIYKFIFMAIFSVIILLALIFIPAIIISKIENIFIIIIVIIISFFIGLFVLNLFFNIVNRF